MPTRYNWLRVLVLLLLVLAGWPGWAQVSVPVDYPGLLWGQDKDRPGIPYKNIDDYKRALKSWGDARGIHLTSAQVDEVISAPYNPGFSQPVTFTYTDRNGNKATGSYFNSNRPLWMTMRDLVFLETFQHAIDDWRRNYVEPLATSSSATFGDAFERADKFRKDLDEYHRSFSGADAQNVLVTYMLSLGSTDFSSQLIPDSILGASLASYFEGIATDALKTGASNLANGDSFVNGLELKESLIGKAEVSQFFIDLAIKYMKENNMKGQALLAEATSGSGFAIAQGGFALPFFAATFLGDQLKEFADAMSNLSQGAHLVNHYYISKTYPEDFVQLLKGSDGRIDFVELPLYPGLIGGAGATDPLLNALCIKHQYTFANMATVAQVQGAYALSNLFQQVEKMDLVRARSEIASYAYLTWLAKHGFALNLARTSATANRFDVSLPGKIAYDPAHQGYPKSITWACDGAAIPAAAMSNVVTIAPGLIRAFRFDCAPPYQDRGLAVTVTYGDGFTRSSTAVLPFLPQHTSVTLSCLTSPATTQGPLSFAATISPDAVAKVSYARVLFHQRKVGGQDEALDISNLLVAGSAGSYTFTFNPGEGRLSYAGVGTYNYWIEADGHPSGTLTVALIDPNDTDGDGIPDAWELKYFPSLSACSPEGDPDGDGASNYVEWKRNTDPTRTGIAQILETQTWNGSGAAPSGELWAHLVVTGGTLDLAGHTLVVHGHLIQSGGELRVNGGRLVVEGDYRIQTRTLAANGTASYSSSLGSLTMINAADSVLVLGSFITHAYYDQIGHFTAGTLEVRGDFQQVYGGDFHYGNFATSGTHRVLLSGTGKQTVTFSSLGAASDHSHFNTLEITNGSTAGVLWVSDFGAMRLEAHGLPLNPLRIGGMSWTLNESETVAGDLQLAGSTLDLNGKTLTIKGNLYHSGGELRVNGGRLVVEGDYRLQTRTLAANGTASYSSSLGSLTMSNAADSVLVLGSFITHAYYDQIGHFTAGTLEVRGDFQQVYGGDFHYANFAATGTHRVLLSGTRKQTVSFGSPGADSTHSHFNILEITNSSPEGVVFLTPYFFSSQSPSFTTQPAPRSAKVGATATFTAVAIGTPVPTLQWQISPKGGSAWTSLPGATGTSYTTPVLTMAEHGCRYRVLASNALQIATSQEALLSVIPDPPTLSGFAPASGYGGTSVTLTGTGFWNVSEIRFNGLATSAFVVESPTRITVTVPAHASTGPIQVVTPGGSIASASAFRIVEAPGRHAGIDLNGDGTADYFLWNASTGASSLFLTHGLDPASLLPLSTGLNPDWHLEATGDFEGLGATQFLWRNRVQGEVQLTTLQGQAITGSRRVHSEPDSGWQIVASDTFDGSGRCTALWWHNRTGQVLAMRIPAAGDATFSAVVTEPDCRWQPVGGGDLDGDGKPDLLWRHAETGQVRFMILDGLAVTGSAIVYTEPDQDWQIRGLADADGDGRTDLLWWHRQQGRAFIMTSHGLNPPSWSLIHTEPDTRWRPMGFAGAGADGRAEVLWQNEASGQFYLLRTQTGREPEGAQIATGPGRILPEPRPQGTLPVFPSQPADRQTVPGQPVSFTLGVQGFPAPDLQWQKLNASGAWQPIPGALGVALTLGAPTRADSGGRFRAIASNTAGTTVSAEVALTVQGGARLDFNGDGKADILWRNENTGQVYLMLMNGAAAAGGGIIWTEPNPAWQIVAAADFDGDGKTDLLWRNSGTGGLFQVLMDGTAVKSAALIYREPNLAWKVVRTGDFNGDGKADLLWRNDLTGQVYLMLMDGPAVLAGATVWTEPNPAWQIIGAADFDGDGKDDILWRNVGTGELFQLLLDGTRVKSAAMIYREPNTAWKVISTSDFNGDGKADLLWRNSATGQVYLMLMNGPAIAAGDMIWTEPNPAWQIVGTGDFDGDGKSDLLWRNSATGELYQMLMNGLGIKSSALIYREPDTAWRILAGGAD